MQISSWKNKRQLTVTQAPSLFGCQEATMSSTHHIIFMTAIASCGEGSDELLLFAFQLLPGAWAACVCTALVICFWDPSSLCSMSAIKHLLNPDDARPIIPTKWIWHGTVLSSERLWRTLPKERQGLAPISTRSHRWLSPGHLTPESILVPAVLYIFKCMDRWAFQSFHLWDLSTVPQLLFKWHGFRSSVWSLPL